eukprot:gene24812-26736_t
MKALHLAGVATLALLAATPALAQTAPAAAGQTEPANPDEAAPGDIVVTAQKRSERLQDVPVAVSVVSGDALATQGKPSLEGAQYLVPSLNFLKSGTTLNQSLFLRGVGTSTFSIAGEPSISTVVDGVVFARAGEAFGDLVDIDHTLGGYVEAGFFTDSEYRGRAVLNVPLGESVRSRLTGFYTNYDGNIRNTTNGKLVNGFEHYGGRLQVDADAGPNVKLAFIADYHHNNDDCCGEVIATGPINAATGAVTTNASTAVLPTPRGTNTRELAQDLVTRTTETGYGFSLQADIQAGTQTVTSITAYRDYKNTEIRD